MIPDMYSESETNSKSVVPESFTNLNGKGLDRLYNQIALSTSQIAPTFEDDASGWSEKEVKTVMGQLHSPDLMDMPTKESHAMQYNFMDTNRGSRRKHRAGSLTSYNTDSTATSDVMNRDGNGESSAVSPLTFHRTDVSYGDDTERDGSNMMKQQIINFVDSGADSEHYTYNSTVNFLNGDSLGAQSPMFSKYEMVPT